MSALAEANRVRIYRGQVKNRLAAGDVALADVLTDVDCATMRVAAILLALPHMGPVKVGKLLDRVRVSHAKLAGGLTTRQRRELLAVVAGDELPLTLPGIVRQANQYEASIEGMLA